VRVVLILALAAFGGSGTGAETVNCHDQVRNLVTRTLTGDCKGTTITENEADTLLAPRRQPGLEGSGTGDLRGIKGYGTGLIVSPDGHVLTSLHIVKSCDVLRLLDPRGRESAARMLAEDPERDLALIISDFTGQSVARIDPAPLTSGDEVTLSGYPYRGTIPRRPSVLSAGIPELKVPGGQVPLAAAIRRGHSGSPVLDDAGRVRGIVRARVNTPKVFAMTGEIVTDIGLATPASDVLAFLAKFGLPRSSGDQWGVSVVRVDCR